ncbi:Prenyltransferase and squalene oxidase repeat protein [Maioricimonas rarisocia]|uniref:Prenyltransferase and squalene oxidase repeat protein n=1 Tax=Maioricimonas rarisocia TaxID=2528026 RepID=A0A517Z0K3_9PLAN|nr:prenyltransferase/squalene oxidase repeat-containing protein [Maioricimonas rarisocia]QDU36022.1 Prenyltransferase and squalene oxidase repeat protein [Maioricimonas rarisocia]
MRTCPAITILPGVLLLLSATQAAADQAALHETVSKAIPYVAAKGVEWIEEKDCVSCHRVSLMTWALLDAKQHGFEVDAGELSGWRTWSREALLSERDEGDDLVGSRNTEALSHILWAERDQSDRPLDGFVALIRQTQKEDGTWPAGGQLPMQKRPADETAHVSTMWNVLALGTTGDADDEALRSQALETVTSVEQAESTEWHALRLLIAVQSRDADVIARWTERLQKHQREDGGWGWRVEDDSDALGTGMALYALSEAGVPSDHDSIRRAVDFLTTTQNDDGSWTVRNTKEKKKTRPAETATYWGTCWAVIGLVATLDEPAAATTVSAD